MWYRVTYLWCVRELCLLLHDAVLGLNSAFWELLPECSSVDSQSQTPAELVGKGFGWWPAPAAHCCLLMSASWGSWITAQHSEPEPSVKISASYRETKPPELCGCGEKLENGNSWAEGGREMH